LWGASRVALERVAGQRLVDRLDRRGVDGVDVDRRATRVGEDATEGPHDVGILGAHRTYRPDGVGHL
jgi:hypothetical protein